MKTKQITQDAMMLALLIICSQLTIPIPSVPLTLQTLAVGLIASVLPIIDTLLVIAIYLILGIVGIPVFSSFAGGFGVIMSPLGGYLIGFLMYGLITSFMLKNLNYSKINIFFSNIAGSVIVLLFGSWWVGIFSHMSFKAAIFVGAVPFILPEIIKICLVVMVAQKVQKVMAINKR